MKVIGESVLELTLIGILKFLILSSIFMEITFPLSLKIYSYYLKISEVRMEILDKKSNRMSRVNVDMSEHSELVEFTANS